jgi:tetratricopeptide (TPR) repeat protein
MKNLTILLLMIFVLYSCKQKTAQENYAIGISKLEIYNFKEAIDYFTKAINQNPNYADAYYMRAKAYLGDDYFNINFWGYYYSYNELTLNQFERAVGVDNHTTEESNALIDLSKAIKLNAKFIEAYKLNAAIKIHKGYEIKAFDDYNKIIDLNLNDDECYIMRAKLKSNYGDYKGAIDDYRKALIIKPKNCLYYLRIGFNYSVLKNVQEELANYQKAYEIDSTQAYILVYIADAKSKLKDYKGAITYYTKYIESKYIDEKYLKKSDVLIFRGKVKILAGLDESGLADFSEAGELGNEQGYYAINEYNEEKERNALLKAKKARNADINIPIEPNYIRTW